MPNDLKLERIRDPLHNLIEFDTKDELERTLWQLMQTHPFQRLRRVRQLGFCEFVFPGATHTRFAHSVGVFHTARKLMKIVKRHTVESGPVHNADVALAAALVHDVGHGMFSHAFEQIGKELGLPLARHETVSEMLIREGEIAEVFGKDRGSGFANDVAGVLQRKVPANLYESIVSSQFDADRLDYMQRDRLMTGVESSGIDETWLLANLEVGSVAASADDQQSGSVETLVLGPKAFHAAESYVLSLFQLYPNVYLHKTTRGFEKMFSCLMLRLIKLVRDGHVDKTGLPINHPIVRFANEPEALNCALALDDSVFLGALAMMVYGEDHLIRDCALRLWDRKRPKCIDIRTYVEQGDPVKPGMRTDDLDEREARVLLRCKQIVGEIKDVAGKRKSDEGQLFIDETRRSPYQRFQDSKTRLNQILIKTVNNQFEDMAHLSRVVASAKAIEICRAYYFEDDSEGQTMIQNIMRTYTKERA